MDLTGCPTLPPCPAARVDTAVVRTNTACLAVVDPVAAAGVWADLLFDGPGHRHGPGGLMLTGHAAGVHVAYDGDFPVRLLLDAAGRIGGFTVDLDPYRDLVDPPGPRLRRDAGVRWTEACPVPLVSDRVLLGDPAGLPEADGTGGLLTVRFPAPVGVLWLAVGSVGGRRREVGAVWQPRG